jgi:hypothetical protein
LQNEWQKKKLIEKEKPTKYHNSRLIIVRACCFMEILSVSTGRKILFHLEEIKNKNACLKLTPFMPK